MLLTDDRRCHMEVQDVDGHSIRPCPGVARNGMDVVRNSLVDDVRSESGAIDLMEPSGTTPPTSDRVVVFLALVEDNPDLTPYQRVALLSQRYPTVVISRGAIAPSVRERLVDAHVVSGPFGVVAALMHLARLRWFGGYNVLYTHYTLLSIILGFIGRRILRYRWIYDLWDHPSLNLSYARGWKRWAYSVVYRTALPGLRAADAWVIGMHERVLDSLPARRPGTRSIHVTNGISDQVVQEVAAFAPAPVRPASADAVRLCYLGLVRLARGVELLLEYIEQAERRGYPSIDLTLCGPTDEETQHAIDAFHARFPGTIRCTGRVPHPEGMRAVAESDACVCIIDQGILSYRYSYSIKIFEYLAVGRPIIATRTAATAQILEGCDAAVLIENTTDGLADAVRMIKERKRSGTIGAMGESGRAHVVRYQWSKINEILQSELAAVIEGEAGTIGRS